MTWIKTRAKAQAAHTATTNYDIVHFHTKRVPRASFWHPTAPQGQIRGDPENGLSGIQRPVHTMQFYNRKVDSVIMISAKLPFTILDGFC